MPRGKHFGINTNAQISQFLFLKIKKQYNNITYTNTQINFSIKHYSLQCFQKQHIIKYRTDLLHAQSSKLVTVSSGPYTIQCPYTEFKLQSYVSD